jgi:DNA-binding response OmpR family regulator
VKRILVVEDDEMVRSFVEILLSHEGYAVRTAAHAGQAVTQLVDFDPHLILMDIQLPETSGLELTRRIKSDPLKRHIPVVAMTAFGAEYHREKAIGAGCADYIGKPFRPKELLALVAVHIDTKEQDSA